MERRWQVEAFADAMEAALRAHDAERGPEGWRDGSSTLPDLQERLREECTELRHAWQEVKGESRAAVVLKETADVGNFAMMIADLAGGLEPPAAPSSTPLVGPCALRATTTGTAGPCEFQEAPSGAIMGRCRYCDRLARVVPTGTLVPDAVPSRATHHALQALLQAVDRGRGVLPARLTGPAEEWALAGWPGLVDNAHAAPAATPPRGGSVYRVGTGPCGRRTDGQPCVPRLVAPGQGLCHYCGERRGPAPGLNPEPCAEHPRAVALVSCVVCGHGVEAHADPGLAGGDPCLVNDCTCTRFYVDHALLEGRAVAAEQVAVVAPHEAEAEVAHPAHYGGADPEPCVEHLREWSLQHVAGVGGVVLRGTYRVVVEILRVRVSVESESMLVLPFEMDVPAIETGAIETGMAGVDAAVLVELHRRCPGLRLAGHGGG